MLSHYEILPINLFLNPDIFELYCNPQKTKYPEVNRIVSMTALQNTNKDWVSSVTALWKVQEHFRMRQPPHVTVHC